MDIRKLRIWAFSVSQKTGNIKRIWMRKCRIKICTMKLRLGFVRMMKRRIFSKSRSSRSDEHLYWVDVKQPLGLRVSSIIILQPKQTPEVPLNCTKRSHFLRLFYTILGTVPLNNQCAFEFDKEVSFTKSPFLEMKKMIAVSKIFSLLQINKSSCKFRARPLKICK